MCSAPEWKVDLCVLSISQIIVLVRNIKYLKKTNFLVGLYIINALVKRWSFTGDSTFNSMFFARI